MNGFFDVSTYASVNAAETDCEAHGGGVLYFPPGTYEIDSSVAIASSKVQWRGAGAGVSKIVGPSSGILPSFVIVQSGVSFFGMSDLAVIGNGVFDPTHTDPIFADPAVLIQSGSYARILRCYFSQNTGIQIQFSEHADGEVANCRFYSFGCIGMSIGDNDHTDATYISASSRIAVHDNYMELGGLGGVRIDDASTACDSSHNVANKIYGSGLAFHGVDTRSALNSIAATGTITGVMGAGSQGIDAGVTNVFALIGNMCSHGDGDGIAMNGQSDGITLGNSCWDNSKVSNECGIQFIGQPSGKNQGNVILGNACFDDGANYQKVGIRMFTKLMPLHYAFELILAGNATYGNTVAGIDLGDADSHYLLQDDSNVVFGNSEWYEHHHTGAPQTTSSTSYALIRQLKVVGGSLGVRWAIRLTGGGTTTGTSGSKFFQIGYGGEGNICTFSSPSTAGSWRFVGYVVNSDESASTQTALVAFYYRGNVSVFRSTLSINSLNDADITLYCKVGNAADAITNDFLLIDRC